MAKDEMICGNCKHHTPPDYCNGENGDWTCGCEKSENYGLETLYGDECEEWEERK